mgnify:CR=1 FL=1
MSKTKIISEQELSQVKYGDLLAKFTELGVKEAWKPGKKKTAMIKLAIEKLDLMRSLEDRGLNQEEITEEIKNIEVIKEEIKVKDAVEAVKKQEKQDKIVKETIVKSKYSREILEKNLKNIKLNLLQAIPQQREMLVKKQEALQAELDKL